MNRHSALAVLMIIFAAAAAAGCGSLSLLSSRHVHYHGSEEVDNKIDQLEKRVEALEKAGKE